jgi:hypothetical protein
LKVSPKADYPVQVITEERYEDDPRTGPLYRGIFRVVLNHMVAVLFVPETGVGAPNWDYQHLSEKLDAITTVEDARLASVLGASYSVTPNDARAGTEDRLEWPAQDTPVGHFDSSTGVIFYVTNPDFARYAADLERLNGIVFDAWENEPVSRLRDYGVIRFIEERIVASPWLGPSDARMLGR